MADYLFRLVNKEEPGKVPAEAREQLMSRPCVDVDSSLNATAELYCADQALEDAINTSIAVGDPLLLTGETGTGKTQAAYYVAWKLDVELFHFQVKSSTTAGDLLYRFDTVRYFHDAHLVQSEGGRPRAQLNKWDYIIKAALWEAFEWGSANRCPAVLLIDEIDKAPRDFPNDLLHELSEMEFTVPELDNHKETCKPAFRPLLFITSNDERRLPPAFLRRCVSHQIVLTPLLLEEAVRKHAKRYPKLDPRQAREFIDLAIRCFWKIRETVKGKPPATGELLTWLEILSAATGNRPDALKECLKDLPYLGTLVKDPDDWERIRQSEDRVR